MSYLESILSEFVCSKITILMFLSTPAFRAIVYAVRLRSIPIKALSQTKVKF